MIAIKMTICVLSIYIYIYIYMYLYRERKIKLTHKDAINCCEWEFTVIFLWFLYKFEFFLIFLNCVFEVSLFSFKPIYLFWSKTMFSAILSLHCHFRLRSMANRNEKPYLSSLSPCHCKIIPHGIISTTIWGSLLAGSNSGVPPSPWEVLISSVNCCLLKCLLIIVLPTMLHNLPLRKIILISNGLCINLL